MANEQQLERLLAEIHKQLVMISTHLEALARVARHEHPDAFTRPESRPAPPPGDRK